MPKFSCLMFVSLKNRVLKLRFLAFPGGPGGFRELREAGRNHFHLSWYLSDSVVAEINRLHFTSQTPCHEVTCRQRGTVVTLVIMIGFARPPA